jgi:histone-lysine N-methyltransferase SETD2/UMP-CMP kinase
LASTASSNEIIKDCIRVNIIEQKVVRKNAALVYRIGNKTSFEQVDSDHVDFFRKENDLTVLGSAAQIAVFREMFAMVESIIRELKKELGIVEGQVKIPVLFLKRVVLALGELEQQHQVNILYNKQAAHMEEIFPLDRMTPIKIKGSKVNIQACVNEINNYIHQLTVYRLYISRSETKTVQQNMFHLRQPNQAEIRISRDSVYRGEHLQRDINHPFFYIQFREKEVCLIGTER